MQTQKGFIQIPLLIIVVVSIVVALAGAGVVLHTQGRLAPLVANISEVFKRNKKIITPEPENTNQEGIPEQPLIEQGTVESQRAQELEQARLEAERAKQTAKAEAKRLAELQRQEEAQKIIEEEVRAEQERLQQRLAANRQPYLILYQDNLGNLYRKEDFKREKEDPSTRRFVSSYSPWCMESSSVKEWRSCVEEILGWIQNRSLNIGDNLVFTLNSFDPDGDEVFYDVRYGTGIDHSWGTERILQSWHTNNNFNIPITEQLFNEMFKEQFEWSIHTFDPDTRKHGTKRISLTNSGDLQVSICFNDKPERMVYPLGEQFSDGCVRFQYFILKSGYSNLTTQ